MSILLDILYALGLILASPMWIYRMVRQGRYRKDLGQRFGAAPINYSRQPSIWIHGVSLGEINAARALVAEIHDQLPDYRVCVSTTTATGMEAAKKHFAPDHVVFRWPLDFSFAVRRALKRVDPELVVLMEGEIWPNFLTACGKRGVKTCIVNARISPDKGYPRYRKLGPLAGWLFNKLDRIGCQSTTYAELYESLGVEPRKVKVTGMLKFDSAPVDQQIPGQDALAGQLGIGDDDRLLVAGGTGPGEETMLLEVYPTLKADAPALRLAIVPRKPERFDEVARLIEQAGHRCIRRSRHAADSPAEHDPDAVILGDTMGELRKFYALADLVFVGRSLVPMGGSDMIEAAALGKPTAFGPHTFNFPQADDLAANGCARVADCQQLTALLAQWLADPDAAASAGTAAQQFVRDNQGATRANVAMICDMLGRQAAAAPGTIATQKLA
ncbi:MAG: 3-deoxy-D-manno-octulosonic acid transferase [Planctomycetota bacterium]